MLAPGGLQRSSSKNLQHMVSQFQHTSYIKPITIADSVLFLIMKSQDAEIPSIVRMLQAPDEGVRDTASGLLKAFALHGELFFIRVLWLLTVIIDVMAEAIGSNVIPRVVKMLEALDEGVRSTASGFLKAFALHGELVYYFISTATDFRYR